MTLGSALGGCWLINLQACCTCGNHDCRADTSLVQSEGVQKTPLRNVTSPALATCSACAWQPGPQPIQTLLLCKPGWHRSPTGYLRHDLLNLSPGAVQESNLIINSSKHVQWSRGVQCCHPLYLRTSLGNLPTHPISNRQQGCLRVPGPCRSDAGTARLFAAG
jgi:hypothetical protein